MAEAMENQGRDRLQIKIGLWLALVLTTAAIVRVGLWRAATPQPAGLNPAMLAALQNAGWRIQIKHPVASSGEELSWAAGLELVNPNRFKGAVLNLVPVQARGPSTYTVETLSRPVLENTTTVAKYIRFGQHDRALFRPRPGSSQQLRSEAACLSNGLALAHPGRILTTKLEKEQFTTMQQQFERLAGLRQTRSWDCLMLVVRQPAKATTSGLWPEVVGLLISTPGVLR